MTPPPASLADNAAPEARSLPPTRVILADTEAIYRVGIRKIIALEDDLRVVAQTETLEQTLAAVAKFSADVLLFDSRLSPTPAEAVSEVLERAPSLKIVAIVGPLDEQETVDYLRRGVRGLVMRAIAPDLLVRCFRKVAEGETWLDNQGVNWIIQAYRVQAAQLMAIAPRGKLSDKERRIVSGVTQGLRNKDIAQEVGTTEQVVKNYLRKIYDKLGVSDRLELALYCVHHRLLEGRGRGEAEPAPPTTTANVIAERQQPSVARSPDTATPASPRATSRPGAPKRPVPSIK
jgi:DNA-binding NarL/FixJ family response regulator